MIRVGIVKDCDLESCHGECTESFVKCKHIPVLILPLYDVEFELKEVIGRLQFGNSNEIAPWTERKIEGDLFPLDTSITVHAPKFYKESEDG